MLRPLALALLLAAGTAAAETRLLMLERPGCEWCEAWDVEVGSVYDKTDEGRQAPLIRRPIDDPLPEGITLDRRALYTPTFVLVHEGVEIGRIEGYPGEDFFYAMLQQLLDRIDANETTEGTTG